MSGDIVPIPREHRERFEPDPDVVEECYKLLEMAKKGELRALAFATVLHDGLIDSGAAGSGFVVNGPTLFALSHAIGTLSRRWGHYCDNTLG